MSYVNPQDVLNPDAKPLSDEQLREVIHDSYRKSYVFIKDHLDPNFIRDGKTLKLDDKAPRGWNLAAFHMLKTPIAINGNLDRILYGFYKIRGPGSFVDEHEASKFAQDIFKSYDSYSRMFATPSGVMQPIISGIPLEDEDAVRAKYAEEIASKKEEEEKFVVQSRLAEERARKINENGIEENSLDDYVRQQLRWHAADRRIETAKKMMEEADKVMDSATLAINEMLSKHPEWIDEGFAHFQREMVNVGEKLPMSYYDQTQQVMEKKDLPGFFL